MIPFCGLYFLPVVGQVTVEGSRTFLRQHLNLWRKEFGQKTMQGQGCKKKKEIVDTRTAKVNIMGLESNFVYLNLCICWTWDASFFLGFRKIYHEQKKSYYKWNQWKPISAIGPWSFVFGREWWRGEVGRFPSLGLISPDAAMGYWIQYWGGKRENSIENIEKV